MSTNEREKLSYYERLDQLEKNVDEVIKNTLKTHEVNKRMLEVNAILILIVWILALRQLF